MKTIGLIGGMSWESTVSYYQIINEVIANKLGGLHSAKIILHSVDFAEIEAYQSKGEWEKSAIVLSDIALSLQNSGADFIVICTNTMHKVVPFMKSKVSIPILHIADATADVLRENHIKKVALLGTKYTMTHDFYKDKIISNDIDVLIPSDDDIEVINSIIYDELCLGIIKDSSKNEFIRVIHKLKEKGAQGIILGCTEIGLLINQEDVSLPVFDTTKIHASTSALLALQTKGDWL